MKPGQTAPRKVTRGLRQLAWWVMRRRQSFTLQELLATVANGTEQDASSNLGKYLRALENAGIIRRYPQRHAGAAKTSNGHIKYEVIVDGGRLAPVWRQAADAVYDPNTDITYPLSEQEASDAL